MTSNPAKGKRIRSCARRFNEVGGEYGRKVQEPTISDFEEHIVALDQRWRELHRIIAERAKDPIMREVPGGTTGLLVHKLRAIGRGDNKHIIDEFTLDTRLLREMRELEKQAAEEVRRWGHKHQDPPEHNGELADWTDEELAELNGLGDKVAAATGSRGIG